METRHGALSFVHTDGNTTVGVTETGGHMTADFTLPNGRVISPYSQSPWRPDEADPGLPPLLTHLRGDFFCLPFGPQQDGPPHGDPANGSWQRVPGSETALTLRITTSDSGALVTKTITATNNALYIRNEVSRLDGRWSYGSHPILDFSHLPDEAGRVTTSPFRWASTYPGLFSNPDNQEYQALQPNTIFTDLAKVPLAPAPPHSAESKLDPGSLPTTDLTRYPARPGHDDLIMLVNAPASPEQPFAWTAAVLDGYAWFCLKNPADFPATLFWISNGGRHSAPWNGIHTKRLGLEEVCSYFCDDVADSRKDLLAGLDIPTTRTFKKGKATILPLIHAVAPVAGDFGAVAAITPVDRNTVRITSDTGQAVDTPCNWPFVTQASSAIRMQGP